MELSRRASLWAAPTIALAVAAPAYATSTTPPPLTCKPKGNRSQRHGKNTRKTWDYHLDPVCGATVLCAWIDGKMAERDQSKRWTVRDLPGDKRERPVHIVGKGGATWSGVVVFS